jgi:hypothetical protein
MKTMNPNKLINLQAKFLFEKSNETMRIKVFLLLMLVTFSTSLSAQVKSEIETPNVREINSYLNKQGALMRTSGNVYSDAKNLEDLISNVQSSVYYYSGVIKTYGEKPKNLFTNISSLAQISNQNFFKNNIEIVVLTIDKPSDLSTIDMALLSSLKNLKYIYIVSKVSVTSQTISNLIINSNEKYSVFYKVDSKDTDQ